MSAKEIWFRRSDGIDMAATPGSASHESMARDGSFTLIDGPDGAVIADQVSDGGQVITTPFAEMKKAELIAYAEAKGIEVNPKLKIADIIGVIEAAEAENQ